MIKALFALMCVAVAACLSAAQSPARDYLTTDEIELVRDAQEIDERIDVLIAAIDRRLTALNIPTERQKPYKYGDEWGPVPKGERIDLLSDVSRILRKAVEDLDNIYERPDSAILPHPDDKRKKPKTVAELFPIAVRSLAAGCERFRVSLARESGASKDRKEIGVMGTSVELCDQVIDAANRLKPLPQKPKN